jgi:hypothetical protein
MEVKPYYQSGNVTVYNCDWRELDNEILRAQLLLTDPPFGIGEARGKNKSRTKLAVAKDYGVSDWDDAPPSELDINRLRNLTKYQIIFGGNYFILPPTKCWLVWDKVNGANDFADCELAWTNLDKAVRLFRYMWNGMLKENPEFRTHPTQKPISVISWALSQATKEVNSLVDPFMGSGTSLVAAKAIGIKAVGVEREERYCADAVNRLSQDVFDWGNNDKRNLQEVLPMWS